VTISSVWSGLRPGARRHSPAADLSESQGWRQVELRAETVASGPPVPATAAGIQHLAAELRIGTRPDEEAWAAAVHGGRVRAISLVSRGQPHSVTVPMPATLGLPLLVGAERLLLIHTHPSAPPLPSWQDIELTRTVVKAANLCGLILEDHVIVGGGGSVASLKELGYLEVP
jgi:hypothetical protein